MNLDETRIRAIVEEVLRSMAPAGVPAVASERGVDGVFPEVDAAVRAAEAAQRALVDLSLEKRKEIVAAIRKTGLEIAEESARRAREETGMGNVPDKIQKHVVVCTLTPGVEDLEQTAWTGDHGLTVVERAPFGVIGAVTPSTHPVPTVLNNAISAIAAGNSIVFNPHPGAKKVSAFGVRRVNQGIRAAGGPANLVAMVENPTIESAGALFKHPGIALLLVTGGPGVARAAMSAPKRAIVAGPGNPPVVVDETADLAKAARDIIAGASFDNNILCIGEKEVFAVASVADELKRQMLANGARELTPPQIEALVGAAFRRDKGEWTLNREMVGRDARVLAERIGVTVPADTKLLIGETGFDHPFVQEEQMMPFLPIVRVPDAASAIDSAIRAEHGYRHTFIIHSRNVETMTILGKRCNASIYVKNGPSFAGLGVGGEGFTSFSIAGMTGEGCTSARTFTRSRRCSMIDYLRIV
jgi:aldehyde dehydrogenase